MVLLPTEKLEALTPAELEQQLQYADGEMQAVRAYKQKVHSIWEQKVLHAQAADKIAKMTPAERAALTQAMGIQGIESKEAVNKK